MTTFHASALDVEPGFFGPVDHVFTDPPYSEHVHRNATTQAGVVGTKHNDLGFAFLSPELRWQIARHVASARLWSLVHCDWEGLSAWITDCERAGATYVRALPWIRWSTPQKSGDRPVQGSECVAVFWGQQGGSKRPHWHGPGNMIELAHGLDWEEFAELRHKAMRGSIKHKTEKPLDQALDLVDWFSDSENLILDLCSGAGTYGVAAGVLRRRFVGLELQKQWADYANQREECARVGVFSERDMKRIERFQSSAVERQSKARAS